MIKTILPSQDGRLRLNDVKTFVRPFWLTPDAPNQALALAAVAGAQTSAPMTVSQEGPFQGFSLVCQSTRFDLVADHEFLVMIQDAGARKQLMNRACHANTIFGTPQFPMVLPERFFLHENRSLHVRMQNIFANANAIRFVIPGRRIYATSAASGVLDDFILDLSERSQVTTPYFLTTSADINNLTVAAGATSYVFPVDADGYFEIFKISAVAYDATLGTMTGTFDFILRDAETRRELETGNLSNGLALGTGLQPNILPESWLVSPRMQLEIVVTNTTATGNPLDAYITLIGRKIYV